MTPTLSPTQTARGATRRRTGPSTRARRERSRGAAASRAATRTLGTYIDRDGRSRELIARPGAAGSLLVVDRDSMARDDCRLVAHLGADEPYENAAVVCRSYLERAPREAIRCRPLSAEDTLRAPFAEGPEDEVLDCAEQCSRRELAADGCSFVLELVRGALSIPELRWRRHPPPGVSRAGETVSLREAIAHLESYEPLCSLTRGRLSAERGNAAVSITVLRLELERVIASPIVLNRALREATLARVERGELSMSEIAIRCGRLKRDRRGNASGETSWLARRLGLLPEGGQSVPTPWIHSDVLGLIAREGLGISPREVEL
jgi:hypothetical protein